MIEQFRCLKCGWRYEAEVADPPFVLYDAMDRELPPPQCPVCAAGQYETVRPGELSFGHKRLMPKAL